MTHNTTSLTGKIMRKKQSIIPMPVVIIPGPAAVGKTTVGKGLARNIDAAYISYDKVMEEHGLDTIEGDGIPTEHFLEADRIILRRVEGYKLVILDGCFYRSEHIENLREKVDSLFIVSLDAPVEECLRRNRERESDMRDNDVRAVHDLVGEVTAGERVDTAGKTTRELINEITALLARNGFLDG